MKALQNIKEFFVPNNDEALWAHVELLFMDQDEFLAAHDQLLADDMGLGINEDNGWTKLIPVIPRWQFWRSV